MRRLLAVIAVLFVCLRALAQFTTVTGTVIDPNGLPYAGGTINATLAIPGGTSPTLNGGPYSPPTQPVGLDGGGTFTMRLADVNVLKPDGMTWSFQVCSGRGSIPPAGGFGPVCFTLDGELITGSDQDISAELQAVALPLGPSAGGSFSVLVNGVPLATSGSANFQNGTGTTVTNPSTNVIQIDARSGLSMFTDIGLLPPQKIQVGSAVIGGGGTVDVTINSAVYNSAWEYAATVASVTGSGPVTVSGTASNVMTFTGTPGDGFFYIIFPFAQLSLGDAPSLFQSTAIVNGGSSS